MRNDKPDALMADLTNWISDNAETEAQFGILDFITHIMLTDYDGTNADAITVGLKFLALDVLGDSGYRPSSWRKEWEIVP